MNLSAEGVTLCIIVLIWRELRLRGGTYRLLITKGLYE